MYSCSLHLLVWERCDQSFGWSPEGVESTCSIARVVLSFYLFPTTTPVQPERQGLPVTGPDSISIPTYSLPRVYVLFLFSVGVLSLWWCSSTSLRNSNSVRHCRTRSLGPRRVWTLFLILFQALLAIAILYQIQPCVRQDRCTCRGLVVHSAAAVWIEGIPLQTSDCY